MTHSWTLNQLYFLMKRKVSNYSAPGKRYTLRSAFRDAGSIATAAYGAYNGYKSFTNTKKGKKSHTGWLTNQYDVKTQYRRRRMPRRRRKAWVRKVRMVNHIVNNKLGSQYQMLRSFNNQTAMAGNQGFFSAGIYGENGSSSVANDFGIDDLYNLDFKSGETSLINKWSLKSGVLDVEIVNIGSEDNLNTMTIDCYEIICRKDMNAQGSSSFNGPADCFNKSFAEQDLLGTNTALGASIPGVTPFQASTFCQHFKILRKTRVLLSPGQATHFMYRDAKDRTYVYDQSSRPVCSRGWYHGFLFICQGVATVGDYAGQINYSITAQRYYDYVKVDTNYVAAGYLNV